MGEEKKIVSLNGKELVVDKNGYCQDEEGLLYKVIEDGSVVPLISPIDFGSLELNKNEICNEKGILYDPYCGVWHKVTNDGKVVPLRNPKYYSDLEPSNNEEHIRNGILFDPYYDAWNKVNDDGEIIPIMLSRDGKPVDPQQSGFYLDTYKKIWIKVNESGKRIPLISPVDGATLSPNENEVYNESGILLDDYCGVWHKVTEDGTIKPLRSLVGNGEYLTPIDDNLFVKSGIVKSKVFNTLHRVLDDGFAIPMRSEVNGAFLIECGKSRMKNHIFTDENAIECCLEKKYGTEEERAAARASSAWYKLARNGKIVPIIREKEGTHLVPAEKDELMMCDMFYDPQYDMWNYVGPDGEIQEISKVYEFENKMIKWNAYTAKAVTYERDAEGNYIMTQENDGYSEKDILEQHPVRTLYAWEEEEGFIFDIETLDSRGEPKICYMIDADGKYVSTEKTVNLQPDVADTQENIEAVDDFNISKELYDESKSICKTLGDSVARLANRYGLKIDEIVNEGINYIRMLDRNVEKKLDISSAEI